jgi:hypothetical protein
MKRFLAGVLLGLLASVASAADAPPGVVIDHQPAATKQYVGSPSIVIAGNGNYIASHDFFGPGSSFATSALTRIFISADRGLTWKQTAEVHDQFWSGLFAVKGKLYLLGTTVEYGRIVIRASADNGATWSDANYLTTDAGYHTTPAPVIEKDGRIYRSMEFHESGPARHFQAMIMSAAVDSDMTQPASWTYTNRLPYPAGMDGSSFLEGSVVVAPDGSIVNVLRVDAAERATTAKLQPGNKLIFDHNIEFPGGAKKFTIRFDPQSKLYWAICTPITEPEKHHGKPPGAVRNTLAMMSSPDLEHWTIRRVLMHHEDVAKHGFQYPDWQFDGNDIVAVVRTAFDDDTGGAHTYHDANYLTFFRVTNFRSNEKK